MLDLFENHLVGFLMMRFNLKMNVYFAGMVNTKDNAAKEEVETILTGWLGIYSLSLCSYR